MAIVNGPVIVTLNAFSQISDSTKPKGIAVVQLFSAGGAAFTGEIYLQASPVNEDFGTIIGSSWITVHTFLTDDLMGTDDADKALSFYEIGHGNNFRLATSSTFVGDIKAALY